MGRTTSMLLAGLAGAVFLSLSFPTTVPGAEAHFAAPFQDAVDDPNLEGTQAFELAPEGGIQRISSSSTSDRQYVRTIEAGYDALDFVYEITFTIAVDEIIFIGLGHGEPDSAPNEPVDSVNFRIHSPGLVNGKVEIQGQIIANLTDPGPHRVQIAKTGNAVTFAIDLDVDGEFQADASYLIPDLKATAPFLKPDDTHLFFGNSELGTIFSDMVVAPNPAATRFRRDDVNGDGRVDITDPISVLEFLFLGKPQSCLDAADFDDNGQLNIADAIALLGYVFQGTLPPRPPSTVCGFDPDQDALGCESYPICN